jgi:hypothetical protein
MPGKLMLGPPTAANVAPAPGSTTIGPGAGGHVSALRSCYRAPSSRQGARLPSPEAESLPARLWLPEPAGRSPLEPVKQSLAQIDRTLGGFATQAEQGCA